MEYGADLTPHGVKAGRLVVVRATRATSALGLAGAVQLAVALLLLLGDDPQLQLQLGLRLPLGLRQRGVQLLHASIQRPVARLERAMVIVRASMPAR